MRRVIYITEACILEINEKPNKNWIMVGCIIYVMVVQ